MNVYQLGTIEFLNQWENLGDSNDITKFFNLTAQGLLLNWYDIRLEVDGLQM